MAGSDAMLIHLGRSVLGQHYKVDMTPRPPQIIYFERAHNPRDQQPNSPDLYEEGDVWSDDDQIPGNGRPAEGPPLEGPVFKIIENARDERIPGLAMKDSKPAVCPSVNGTH
jgi:hypothetical protein